MQAGWLMAGLVCCNSTNHLHEIRPAFLWVEFTQPGGLALDTSGPECGQRSQRSHTMLQPMQGCMNETNVCGRVRASIHAICVSIV